MMKLRNLYAMLVAIALVFGLIPALAFAVPVGDDTGLTAATPSLESDGEATLVFPTDGTVSYPDDQPVSFVQNDDVGVVSALMNKVASAIRVQSGVEVQTSGLSDSGCTSVGKPTLSQIKAAWDAIPEQPKSASIFAQTNNNASYTPGNLTSNAEAYAKAYLNFIRYSAGLSNVDFESNLNTDAAHGALLLAKRLEVDPNQQSVLDHFPGTPEGVSNDQANRGKYACQTSNLSYGAISAGGSYPVLQMAIQGQIDDSSGSNLTTLGHRRWLLNPSASVLGIGSATVRAVRSGYTWDHFFTDIRVFNNSNPTGASYDSSYGSVVFGGASDYKFVAWPASGNFANNVFSIGTPWSITLNPNQYQAPTDDVQVTVTRIADNASWSITSADATPSTTGKYLLVENRSFGVNNCIIFNPGSDNVAATAYEGSYRVDVTGLKTNSGTAKTLSYQVDFVDANSIVANQAEGTSGTCSWSIDASGKLTIRPTNGNSGTLAQMLNGTVPWWDYRGLVTSAVIEPGVYASGSCQGLFSGFSSLEELDLSGLDTTNISTDGLGPIFEGCSSLARVTLGSKFAFGESTLPSAPSGQTYTGKWVKVTGGNAYDAATLASAFDADSATMAGTYTWQRDMTGATIVQSETEFTYDGQPHGPQILSVTLADGTSALLDSFIIPSYSDCIDAGVYAKSFQSNGLYAGSGQISFTINPAQLTGVTATLSQSEYEYDGQPHCPEVVTVKRSDNVVIPLEQCDINYPVNPINVGLREFSVRAKSGWNYEFCVPVSFEITPASLTGAAIVAHYDSAEGSVVVDSVTTTKGLSVPDDSLTIDSTWSNGGYVVTVEGKGNYCDTASTTVSVPKTDISGATVTLSATGFTYNGQVQQPVVSSVTLGVDTIPSDAYDVSYSAGCKNAGDYTVTVAAKADGWYTGSAAANFTIAQKALDENMIADIPNQEYAGTSVEPTLTVTNGSETLELGRDYTVSYDSNAAIGAASATITAKDGGNYSGQATKSFTIVRKPGYYSFRDTWRFENWAEHVGKQYYQSLYGNAFGESMYKAFEFKYDNVGGALYPTNTKDYHGVCYGMALSSLSSAWRAYPPASSYRLGSNLATDLYDVAASSGEDSKNWTSGETSRSAFDEIMLGYAAQFDWDFVYEEAYHDLAGGTSPGLLEDLVEAVEESERGGDPVEVVIDGSFGGHALWALGVEQNTSQTEIRVYDCNYPGTTRSIVLKKNESDDCTSWKYDGGFYTTGTIDDPGSDINWHTPGDYYPTLC